MIRIALVLVALFVGCSKTQRESIKTTPIQTAKSNHLAEFSNLPKNIAGKSSTGVEFELRQSDPKDAFGFYRHWLELKPAISKTPSEIRGLVLDVCDSLPNKGWKEDRELVAEHAQKNWELLLSINNGKDNRSFEQWKTDVYLYEINCSNFPADGTPPRIVFFREVLDDKKP